MFVFTLSNPVIKIIIHLVVSGDCMILVLSSFLCSLTFAAVSSSSFLNEKTHSVFTDGSSDSNGELYTGIFCDLSEPGDTDDFVFEGIEKRIEIFFGVGPEDSVGLLALPRNSWEHVCSAAVCTIIHHEPSERFDSYILSESSLFVFRDRVMIKTCGTTRPLFSVDAIISEARKVGLQALDMTYSRGSFLFPDRQPHPHNDLETEIDFLTDMSVDGMHIRGKTCLIGKQDGLYWLVHRKQLSPQSDAACTDTSNRIMVDCIMTGLPDDAREKYFKSADRTEDSNEAFMSDSVQPIEPSYRIAGKCYDPCGYSCNAHSQTDERYFTVHITPEKAFSYASVEAVFRKEESSSTQDLLVDIHAFVERVIAVFRPGNIIVTVLSPNDSVTADAFPREIHMDSRYSLVDAETYSFNQDSSADDIVASSIVYIKGDNPEASRDTEEPQNFEKNQS